MYRRLLAGQFCKIHSVRSGRPSEGLLGFLPIGFCMKWYDILPYKKGEDDINGIKALLDHVGNFVIVIHRGDSGEVGISIGARKEMSTAITMLDGMEVMVRDEFDFERHKKYRRYKHKRHCAIPISGRDADLESLYGILDREVSGLGLPGSKRQEDGVNVQGILVHTLHGERAVARSHVIGNVGGVHAVQDQEHIGDATEPHPERKVEDSPVDPPVLMRDHLRRHWHGRFTGNRDRIPV